MPVHRLVDGGQGEWRRQEPDVGCRGGELAGRPLEDEAGQRCSSEQEGYEEKTLHGDLDPTLSAELGEVLVGGVELPAWSDAVDEVRETQVFVQRYLLCRAGRIGGVDRAQPSVAEQGIRREVGVAEELLWFDDEIGLAGVQQLPWISRSGEDV